MTKVPVRKWWCAVPDSSCMDKCTPIKPHDPDLLRVDGERPDPFCGEIITLQDAEKVMVYCEAHFSEEWTEIPPTCMLKRFAKVDGPCNMAVYELHKIGTPAHDHRKPH